MCDQRIGIDLEILFHYRFLNGKYTSPKKESTLVLKKYTQCHLNHSCSTNPLVIFEASETVRKILELLPTNYKNDLFPETGNKMA
jgi:hypothetical protein